ncbi:hypothetical protein N2382_04660 [SAR92 clade bacterium H921]|jgi:hypothetical protein|nr:hypothetical protein [SAR92 clade bacterium H921]
MTAKDAGAEVIQLPSAPRAHARKVPEAVEVTTHRRDCFRDKDQLPKLMTVSWYQLTSSFYVHQLH